MCGAISRCAISAARSPICRCSSVSSNAACWVASASLITIKASAALAAEPTGGDVLAQQRTWTVLRITEAVVKHVHDRQARIQTDEVRKLQRPHGVIHTELHHRVDRFGRSD